MKTTDKSIILLNSIATRILQIMKPASDEDIEMFFWLVDSEYKRQVSAMFIK